ncbi:PASTA domain-containing protein [Mycoplasmatota bacterium WC44]
MNDNKEKLNDQEESLDLSINDFDFDAFDEEDDDEEAYEYTPKKSYSKTIIVSITILVGIILSWFLFFRGSTVTPNMVNWSKYQVDEWVDSNDVEVTYLYEYNTSTPENSVIKQSILENTKVKKNMILEITLSEGFNPNEVIDVIDLSTANNSDIQNWIDSNHLTNVELNYSYNTLVPENQIVSYEFKSGSQSTFKRKDQLVIEISKGSSSNQNKVTLPNLTEMTLHEALAWGESNQITLKTNYVYSQYVSADTILKQDINAGTKVSPNNIINLSISLGKQIIVPNFSSLTQTRAVTWATDNGVSLTLNTAYSSYIEEGYFIEQSLQANEIIAQRDNLSVTYSLGKIDMYSYVGTSILQMKSDLDALNLNGANITYSIEYVYTTSYSAGMVVSHSFEHSELSPGSVMTILVSEGESVFVPDFKGLDQTTILNLCQSNEMVCVFKFKNYPSPAGWLISQSVKPGEVISKNDPVTITLSLGSS